MKSNKDNLDKYHNYCHIVFNNQRITNKLEKLNRDNSRPFIWISYLDNFLITRQQLPTIRTEYFHIFLLTRQFLPSTRIAAQSSE